MRYLLVSITLIFSFIFYCFYTASIWKNIFLQTSQTMFYGQTLLWSFVWMPIIFFLLAVFLFFYFRSEKEEIKSRPVQEKNRVNNFIWLSVIILLIIIIFFLYWNFSFLYSYILFFIFSSLYFLWEYFYNEKKIIFDVHLFFKIFSIISAYWVSIIWIIISFLLINTVDFSSFVVLFFYLWLFSISLFHVYIHLKYENIISLWFWIITCIFSLYRWIDVFYPWII